MANFYTQYQSTSHGVVTAHAYGDIPAFGALTGPAPPRGIASVKANPQPVSMSPGAEINPNHGLAHGGPPRVAAPLAQQESWRILRPGELAPPAGHITFGSPTDSGTPAAPAATPYQGPNNPANDVVAGPGSIWSGVYTPVAYLESLKGQAGFTPAEATATLQQSYSAVRNPTTTNPNWIQAAVDAVFGKGS
jgi:hypothetical protein